MERFDAERDLSGLDEPVRRYFSRALRDGATMPRALELTMRGRINTGMWLSFSARQRFVDHAFEWCARAGLGPLRPLHVVDTYDGRGGGITDGRLLDRLRFLHAEGEDVGRAAAGRAAAESVWRPWMLLPSHGVTWRAETEDLVVAALKVEPENVELRLRLTPEGGVRELRIERWGDVGRDGFGYIPFGGDVLADARFGDWLIPARLRVGWWYGTPRYKPFFHASIVSVEPVS
jgi:hypothetical protein